MGLALLAQLAVERGFGYAIKGRRRLDDAPPFGAPRREHPQPSPQVCEGFGRDGMTCHRVVSPGSLPQAGKAMGGCASIARSVFGVPMPQIILDEAQIVATVRQGITAAMAQHVGMDVKR